jgi:hypothetical protein
VSVYVLEKTKNPPEDGQALYMLVHLSLPNQTTLDTVRWPVIKSLGDRGGKGREDEEKGRGRRGKERLRGLISSHLKSLDMVVQVSR